MTRQGTTIYLAAGTALGLVGTAAGALVDTRAAAAAWLFAVMVVLGLSTGAISLLLTGRLTGGAWIEALAPVLASMARGVPLVGLAFVPLLFAARLLYPWAAEGAHHPQVETYYLNWLLITLRPVVAFAGWSLIAFATAGLPGSRGQIAAALGLVFHVVMLTFLGFDWLAALQSGFTSSVLGAQLAILSLLSALALAALIAPPEPGKTLRDVAGLIIAGVLGSVYIGFMQFLIIWYGDLHETAQFYLGRAGMAGVWAVVAILFIGAFLPLVLLFPAKGRSTPARVRAAAFLVLFGIVLHWGWVALGLFPLPAIVIAPFALLTTLCGLALIGRARGIEKLASKEHPA